VECLQVILHLEAYVFEVLQQIKSLPEQSLDYGKKFEMLQNDCDKDLPLLSFAWFVSEIL